MPENIGQQVANTILEIHWWGDSFNADVGKTCPMAPLAGCLAKMDIRVRALVSETDRHDRTSPLGNALSPIKSCKGIGAEPQILQLNAPWHYAMYLVTTCLAKYITSFPICQRIPASYLSSAHFG